MWTRSLLYRQVDGRNRDSAILFVSEIAPDYDSSTVLQPTALEFSVAHRHKFLRANEEQAVAVVLIPLFRVTLHGTSEDRTCGSLIPFV